MTNFDFVVTNYSVEVSDFSPNTLGLSKEWVEELELELGKRERKLRDAIKFLQDMGDIDVSYEGDLILIEIISENAEKVSLKVDNLIRNYNGSVEGLPNAYKALAELEAMLA
jgi:uncharacterized protein YpiB (UPF0302 family)